MVFLQLSCWVPCIPLFFLGLLGLVKRSLWIPQLRALWIPALLCCIVWISFDLWFCDRLKIESKSSRFRWLSPDAWSQPTFVRYKTFTHFLQQFILLWNLLPWRSGHPQDLSCNGPYHRPWTQSRCRSRWVGMKADQIGSDNTFTTSTSILFCWMWSGVDAVTDADCFGCQIWCGVRLVSERMRINIVK
jgi:hypothetical protein